MCKTIIILLVWISATLCQAQQPGALLRLEKNEIDFGAIAYESEVTDSLKLYNDGTEPLVITSVFSDCGCTVPSYNRAPIAPGDSGTIAVRFNSRGRAAGTFRKAVRIRSNSEPPNKVLFVTGRIKRPYLK